MKTNEFQANAYKEYLNALNKKSVELVKEEEEREARCLADAEGLPTPEAKAEAVKGCRLHLLAKSLSKITTAYKAARLAYLLETNEEYKTAQANVIRLAAANFADTKEDGEAFIQWMDTNGKAEVGRIVDTPDRLTAALRDLYKDYTKGRKALVKTKAEREAEKAKANDIFALLANMSAEERAKLKAAL